MEGRAEKDAFGVRRLECSTGPFVAQFGPVVPGALLARIFA
jgi:hypothetical protein